jgi:hypothetical protein
MTERKRKKSPRDRTRLDRELWERYDETTRRLLERIEYHKRTLAAEKAARGETRPDRGAWRWRRRAAILPRSCPPDGGRSTPRRFADEEVASARDPVRATPGPRRGRAVERAV